MCINLLLSHPTTIGKIFTLRFINSGHFHQLCSSKSVAIAFNSMAHVSSPRADSRGAKQKIQTWENPTANPLTVISALVNGCLIPSIFFYAPPGPQNHLLSIATESTVPQRKPTRILLLLMNLSTFLYDYEKQILLRVWQNQKLQNHSLVLIQ